ncbi:MAG: glycosyltransferase family 1 protein [Solirubrobacterales bacterium]|nr:glycosyltransferase family 1 protein [Solirubrobacterales bacterium]
MLTPEFAPYAWGGLSTYLHEVVPRLVAAGVEVDVVVSPTYARSTVRAEVDGLPAALFVDAEAEPEEQYARVRAKWDRPYDVAFVQDPQAAPLASLLLARSVCRRVVATAHLPTYSGFSYFDKPEDDARHQAQEAMLFRLSHRVLAPSAFAADVVLQVHRLGPDDVAVVPYGASGVLGPPRQRASDKALEVMTVSRIAKQKGLEDLCAIAELTPEHVAAFTHVGTARKGDDGTVLDRSRIRALGHRRHSEALSLVREADIALSTSTYETFGLSLLEGMAAGAVPVAFECGAYYEFIEPGVSGVFVAPGDVGAAVETLTELHRDRDYLGHLRRGAVTAAKRLSWETHVTDLLTVLSDG